MEIQIKMLFVELSTWPRNRKACARMEIRWFFYGRSMPQLIVGSFFLSIFAIFDADWRRKMAENWKPLITIAFSDTFNGIFAIFSRIFGFLFANESEIESFASEMETKMALGWRKIKANFSHFPLIFHAFCELLTVG